MRDNSFTPLNERSHAFPQLIRVLGIFAVLRHGRSAAVLAPLSPYINASTISAAAPTRSLHPGPLFLRSPHFPPSLLGAGILPGFSFTFKICLILFIFLPRPEDQVQDVRMMKDEYRRQQE